MNFFGHAVVAGWMDDSPEFVLGAMLPDFVSMCGAKIAGVDSELVQDGIEFHHRTDAVFHVLPWFTLRHRRLTSRLRTRGVRRGPALGAGHVGIEIALDAVLADGEHDDGSFARALEEATGSAAWTFIDPAGLPRFQSLVARIREAPSGAGADVIATRVERTLHRRPLLRLEDREFEPLRDALADELDEIRDSHGELLSAMRTRLL